MNEFNQSLYTAGFRDAERDIKNEGIGYAERNAANQCAGNVNGDFYVIGYRTAVVLYRERQMSN